MSDLWDPKSNLCCNILFIYSLESFLPYSLNRASYLMEESKIETLGPFAYVLAVIIAFAQRFRNDRIDG
jgi:hypothetical protein